MILAIDVGNTNVVMGFIEGDTIVDKYRLSTNSNETARSMPSSCTVCWI